MTAVTLIWNIFVWSFTGLMIYVTSSSLWWLILPALFTGSHNAAEIIRHAKKDDSSEYEFDEETRKKLMSIVEQAEKTKKGDHRREWV
jgi:hypothetical protein